MPKVKPHLIDVFASIAKREAHKIFRPTHAQFKILRKIILEQTKRIHELEKRWNKLSPDPKKAVPLFIPEKPLHITSQRIAKLRLKLGLSQLNRDLKANLNNTLLGRAKGKPEEHTRNHMECVTQDLERVIQLFKAETVKYAS